MSKVLVVVEWDEWYRATFTPVESKLHRDVPAGAKVAIPADLFRQYQDTERAYLAARERLCGWCRVTNGDLLRKAQEAWELETFGKIKTER